MARRILGQNIQILIMQDGRPFKTLTQIKEIAWDDEYEELSDGLIGETTDRQDSVKKRVSGHIVFQHETNEIVDLLNAFDDVAESRTPGRKIDVSGTGKFDGGGQYRVTFPDVQPNTIGQTIAGRSRFVETRVPFRASDRILTKL